MFWSSEKRWRFLQACCGLGPHHPQYLDIELLYRDLDLVGELRDVNTKWVGYKVIYFETQTSFVTVQGVSTQI